MIHVLHAEPCADVQVVVDKHAGAADSSCFKHCVSAHCRYSVVVSPVLYLPQHALAKDGNHSEISCRVIISIRHSGTAACVVVH